MPSNNGYLGTAKNLGVMGGDAIGINAEKFWGGVHRFQDSNDVPDGSFFGVGGSVPEPNIGFYGSLSYAYEILQVDQTGYQWFRFQPGIMDIFSDIGEVLWHDIFRLP
jgi:hypothetical protein